MWRHSYKRQSQGLENATIASCWHAAKTSPWAVNISNRSIAFANTGHSMCAAVVNKVLYKNYQEGGSQERMECRVSCIFAEGNVFRRAWEEHFVNLYMCLMLNLTNKKKDIFKKWFMCATEVHFATCGGHGLGWNSWSSQALQHRVVACSIL